MDTYAFIGARDTATEGVWTWPSGLVVGGYANWKTGQPSGGAGKNCAYMDVNTGEWVGEDCEYPTAYVCKKSAAGIS